MWTRFIQEEKGYVLVFTTICLTVLLGLVSLVTDAGLLYLNRLHLVDGVDAAALAGVQELPASSEQAFIYAREYAVRNGLKEAEITLEVSQGRDQVTVLAEREVPLFFARVLGKEKATITALATAQIRAAARVRGVAPLGIRNQPLAPGELYTLKVGDSPQTAGEFGALTLGFSGADAYEENLKHGYDKYLQVGDVIETETGNMSNPTYRGINYRIAQDQRVPASTYDDFDKDCPRVIIVPVYEPVDPSSNQMKQVVIVGFAAFFVEEVLGQGNESVVKGYFVRLVTEGEGEEEVTGPPGYGLYTARLIR